MITPTSSFEQAQFTGNATLKNRTSRKLFFEVDGHTFIVRKRLWEEALMSEQSIQFGERCQLVRQGQIQEKKIDPDSIQTTLLANVPVDPALYTPIKSGTELDGFWSRKGGVMPGTITMVTGDPGIGKSSVMMDLLQGVKNCNPGKKVLYVSAEMTRVDMMDPDEFMKYYPGLHDTVEFMFASDYLQDEGGPSFTHAFEVLLARGYDLVVLDSMAEIQSLVHEDLQLSSGKASEKALLNMFQYNTEGKNGVYTAFLLIQQVKKDGEFVGSRRLEHMITAFLSIKWDKQLKGQKYLEFRKNRKGDVLKRLYFKLGNGVEYDIEKFNDERELEHVMSLPSAANGLTQLEFQNLMQGIKAIENTDTDVEESEDFDDE